MRGLVFAVVGAALAAGIVVVTVSLASGVRSGRDPFLDEVAAVNGQFAAEWDGERDHYRSEQEWDSARAAWRVRWAREVRRLCEEHGRDEPAWVRTRLDIGGGSSVK